ncbi:AMP-binding protein [Sulfurisphaera tokodaii]|uniref:acetate--CoA ligase n=2 Tax=Sulfurisphaera tokodaii TaxID=111955 RepID=Q96ZN6_SULTO|nr:AMP-binding protein [Sulfurisphaera tokodaii]BAB66888.1 putative acetyl-CoA synthetase [Sulfurisphaera tokodaii str. 7]HII73834.1 AMP-binding protein [Sulfurisphaera tokodaii]
MSWLPTKDWIEESNVYSFMLENDISKLSHFISYTYEKPEEFWDKFVKRIGLKFYSKYDKVLDLSQGKPWAKWFINGKLNIGDQIPDSSEVFIKWMDEKENSRTITYSDVLQQAKAVSSWLKKFGLKKGDTVGIYMPMIPEIVPVFLGIARAGMIAVPLFSGFGKEPIRVRAEDSGMKVIFTTDMTIRKGKEINSLENLEGLTLTKVVVERGGKKDKDSISYSEVLSTAGDGLEVTDTEDPFMIIYTSGTTGKPKGCVHTHDGFPIKASADVYFQFDLKKRETLMWVTDLGWMMGPWMILSALLLRGKIGMIEGYTAYSLLSKFIEDMKVDILGLSASLIRAFRSEVEKGKLDVRIVGNTGEPIDYESWKWLYEAVKGPIINYSGGTEISGGILGNYVINEIKPTAFNGFSPGIHADVFDENGKHAPANVEGELVVLSVWPGMARGFWKDKERYLNTYWSRWEGVWVHGDLAYYDEDGFYYIVGRSDDTIKVAGKRVGPAEVEQIINSYEGVVESACVGVPDPMKGEEILCFAVTNKEIKKDELLNYTQRMLGKALAPKDIIFVKELPKTRNAKIMRRLIRAVVLGKPTGDISALENPSALEEIKKALTS